MAELKRYSWCHDEQKMIEDYLGAYVRQEEALKIRNEFAKANEIISECWRLVGNDVDSKSALPESVNSLNERVKDLEAQLKRLIDYEADQALLPEASSQGTRQLVNDIKNDATDVGGCYEVSCGLLDSLFEHYADKGASKLLNKFAVENQCKAIDGFTSAFVESNYKHDVPVMGRLYNEKMRETILNALQKSAEKSIKQLRKEQDQ